jgi:hypothetical protein
MGYFRIRLPSEQTINCRPQILLSIEQALSINNSQSYYRHALFHIEYALKPTLSVHHQKAFLTPRIQDCRKQSQQWRDHTLT